MTLNVRGIAVIRPLLPTAPSCESVLTNRLHALLRPRTTRNFPAPLVVIVHTAPCDFSLHLSTPVVVAASAPVALHKGGSLASFLRHKSLAALARAHAALVVADDEGGRHEGVTSIRSSFLWDSSTSLVVMTCSEEVCCGSGRKNYEYFGGNGSNLGDYGGDGSNEDVRNGQDEAGIYAIQKLKSRSEDVTRATKEERRRDKVAFGDYDDETTDNCNVGSSYICRDGSKFGMETTRMRGTLRQLLTRHGIPRVTLIGFCEHALQVNTLLPAVEMNAPRVTAYLCPPDESSKIFSLVAADFQIQHMTKRIPELKGAQCILSAYVPSGEQLDNGSYTNFLAELINGELQVYGIGTPYTPEWTQDIYFVTPNYLVSLVVIVRKSEPMLFLDTLIRVFDPLTWLLIGLLVVTWSCFFTVMQVVEIGKFQVVHAFNKVFFTIEALMTGAISYDRLRFLWVLLSFTSLVLLNAISGSMYSYLSVPYFHGEIDTLRQLSEATDVIYSDYRDMLTFTLIEKTDEFYNLITKIRPIESVEAYERIYEKMKYGKRTAIIMISPHAEIIVTLYRHMRQGHSLLRIMQQSVKSPCVYGFLLRRGSTLERKLDMFVLALQQSGITQKDLENAAMFFRATFDGSGLKRASEVPRPQPLSMTLVDQLAFVYLWAVVASLVVFILEICFFFIERLKSIRYREHRPS